MQQHGGCLQDRGGEYHSGHREHHCRTAHSAGRVADGGGRTTADTAGIGDGAVFPGAQYHSILVAAADSRSRSSPYDHREHADRESAAAHRCGGTAGVNTCDRHCGCIAHTHSGGGAGYRYHRTGFGRQFAHDSGCGASADDWISTGPSGCHPCSDCCSAGNHQRNHHVSVGLRSADH